MPELHWLGDQDAKRAARRVTDKELAGKSVAAQLRSALT